MTADLDTVLTALYVELTDRIIPLRGPGRRGPGRPPDVTDAELACLAVAQVLLRCDDERHWLRAAPRLAGHLFPRLPAQSQYNTRLRQLAPPMEAALRWLADATPATAVITGKGLSGQETEEFFDGDSLGLTLIRPARKDEKQPRPTPHSTSRLAPAGQAPPLTSPGSATTPGSSRSTTPSAQPPATSPGSGRATNADPHRRQSRRHVAGVSPARPERADTGFAGSRPRPPVTNKGGRLRRRAALASGP